MPTLMVFFLLFITAGFFYSLYLFRKPFLITQAFVITLAFGPLLSIPFTKEGFLLSLAILFSAFIAWVAKAILTKDTELFSYPFSKTVHILLIVLYLVMIISLKNSSHFGKSLPALKRFLYCIIIYFYITYSIKNELQLKTIIYTMLVGYLGIALLGLYEATTGKYVYEHLNLKSLFGADVPAMVLRISERGRIQGIYGNAEFHSFRMLSFFLLSLYPLFVVKKKLFRSVVVFYVFAALLNIVGVAYRGAVLSFSVTITAYFYLLRLKNKWFVAGLAVAGILMIGVCAYFLFPDLDIERLGKTEGQAVSTIVMRKNNTIIGFNMAMDKPIFGQGPDGFIIQYNKFNRGFPETRMEETKTHNTYIQVLAEYGFTGFLTFLAILFFTLRSLFLQIRRLDGERHYLVLSIFAALLSYVVIMIGANALLDHNFWLIISVAGAAIRIYGDGKHPPSLDAESV